MTKPAIEVKNLSKSYIINHKDRASYKTIKDDFTSLVKRPFSKLENHEEKFWALKDVSFEIEPGEIFGVIGRNGSGKSTLLTILSRIVQPTRGSVTMRGRVAGLLEVGTGFHPELTGRENIFFNGSMLGMSKKEIEKKFDEIVAFSEVEKFIDTPVKFYSSGMYVRLAFSVAAHLDPDILILDEVLAVGDANFQKKSMGKIKSIMKNSGTTVLFVSHSMTTVRQLCKQSMLLENGSLKYIGDSDYVADKYLNETSRKSIPEIDQSPDDKTLKLISKVEIINTLNEKVSAIKMGDDWVLLLDYTIIEWIDACIVGVEILDIEGNVLYMTSNQDSNKMISGLSPGSYKAKLFFSKFHLAPGTYYLRISIQSPGVKVFDSVENIPITIKQSSSDIRLSYFKGKFMGFIEDKSKWEIREEGNND